jgi:hypothetical protein
MIFLIRRVQSYPIFYITAKGLRLVDPNFKLTGKFFTASSYRGPGTGLAACSSNKRRFSTGQQNTPNAVLMPVHADARLLIGCVKPGFGYR